MLYGTRFFVENVEFALSDAAPGAMRARTGAQSGSSTVRCGPTNMNPDQGERRNLLVGKQVLASFPS